MDLKREEFFYSRLEDLKRCAIRGNLGISAFFSPREIFAADEYLKRSGAQFAFFGGYGDAERKKCYFLPEFMEGMDDITKLSEYGYSSEVAALQIKGSGFESLSHRAIMGSILGLGVQRDAIGDIILISNSSAVFFCDEKLCEFFLSDLKKIGRDTVKVECISIDSISLPERRFLQISDTVASARLDCIVAALCSLSRERAKERIEQSLVELNYEIEERPDKEVSAPAILSIRGVGKFRVLSVSDKTKKGRYRLLAEKYL